MVNVSLFFCFLYLWSRCTLSVCALCMSLFSLSWYANAFIATEMSYIYLFYSLLGIADTVRGLAIMPDLGILSASHDGYVFWLLSTSILGMNCCFLQIHKQTALQKLVLELFVSTYPFLCFAKVGTCSFCLAKVSTWAFPFSLDQDKSHIVFISMLFECISFLKWL